VFFLYLPNENSINLLQFTHLFYNFKKIKLIILLLIINYYLVFMIFRIFFYNIIFLNQLSIQKYEKTFLQTIIQKIHLHL